MQIARDSGDRMDANSTAGPSRINYCALTISAPHRIANIHVVTGGTDPGSKGRGTIRPC
jgi:hypothetical protein